MTAARTTRDVVAHDAAEDEAAYDVVVVGAGPAGTAASVHLARAGRRVILIDRATFPRDKCCGDGLTTLALRELEALGLQPPDVTDWFAVRDVEMRSPSGRTVAVELPGDGTYAAIAPRVQLDDALVRLAEREGVEVLEGHAFESLGEAEDHLLVGAGGLTLRARYVIAADGMWSPVRKAVTPHAPVYKGEWHGARQYAHGVTGTAANTIHVWFEPDLVPGYAWSFPLPGGRANVGFGVLRDGVRKGRDLKALWSDLIDRDHIAAALGPDARLEDRLTAWPIPARVDEVDLAIGRVLFVGDAAAATDVMTGEGIGQALLTGSLAADAIIESGALQPEACAARYTRSVRHHLFADHRMSKALGAVLGHPLGARGALRVVDHSGAWGRRNFARWMFEDEPRAIAVTPTRWHRGFLTRPGAYVDSSPR